MKKNSMKKDKKNSDTLQEAKLTPQALLDAYFDCAKRKRKTVQAMEFEFYRERNLAKLYNELSQGSYEIGKSICFIVCEPKYREVWAGAFRDRIVHHLIYNALYERFLKRFIYDSYSCIPLKGTLKAAQKARKMSLQVSQNYTRKAYFLKMDIKNYFVSIDKEILFDEIKKYVGEKWLIDLIQKVIFHDPRKNVYLKSPKYLYKKLPKYKSLFNTDAKKGLPIGNLTSQFFSNVYLNKLDQYAKHVLKCRHYARYVDDIVVLDEDYKYLNWVYSKIDEFLRQSLNMELNHKKKILNLVDKGFDFVGHTIRKNCVHLRVRTKHKCFSAVRAWQNNQNKFSYDELVKIRDKVNSYLGMARHVSGFNFRRDVLSNFSNLFFAIDKNYTKLKLV